MLCTLLNLLQGILIIFGAVWVFLEIFYPNHFINKYLDELLKKIPIKLNPVLRVIVAFLIGLSILFGVILLPELGNCI